MIALDGVERGQGIPDAGRARVLRLLGAARGAGGPGAHTGRVGRIVAVGVAGGVLLLGLAEEAVHAPAVRVRPGVALVVGTLAVGQVVVVERAHAAAPAGIG